MTTKDRDPTKNQYDASTSELKGRITLVKSFASFTGKFWTRYPGLTMIIIITSMLLLVMKNFGFAPIVMMNRYVLGIPPARRWNVTCLYSLTKNEYIENMWSRYDLDAIISSVASNPCDFMILQGPIDDQSRKHIESAKINVLSGKRSLK